MPSPKKVLDWIFIEELDNNEFEHLSQTDIHDHRAAETKVDQRFPRHLMFELLLIIAIVYSVTLYLIWQHSEVQMATLKQELVALRQEVVYQKHLAPQTAKNEDTIRLAQQFIATVANEKPKVQWQPMFTGLQLYLDRELRRPGWQQEEAYVARRQFAATQSLLLTQRNPAVENHRSEVFRQRMPIADELADPLIEFIFNSFGYTILPSLLQAFEEYESWETLAPGVFEISAQEFEARWHAYLEEEYLLNKKNSVKP